MEERHSGRFSFICGKWPLEPNQSTIVFIHGSGGSAQFWGAQVQGLAERTNAVALDLPGHGRSQSDGETSVDGYVTALIEFLDTLDPPGPILCGSSLGGAIAQQLLLEYPYRFGAGILVGTGGKLKVLPAIFEAIDNDFKGFVNMITKLSASDKAGPAAIRQLQNDLIHCGPGVVGGDFQACNRFDVMARLGEIKVPVLIVSAEEDQLTPPKYADFLESAIPHTVRSDISDAGHIAPLEKPQAVNKAIIEFLDTHGL
jgi:pimeloyl-ACP methyl ester carboxylesterase